MRSKNSFSFAAAESFLLSKLDDLMWLFNIRGCDVECNPVALSYGYITEEETVLFVQGKALDEAAKSYLARKQIVVKEYAEIVAYLKALPEGGKVLADMGAAVLIEEKDLTDRAIVSAFESMYSDTTKTKQMGELARGAYQQDCLDIIYKNLNL